MKTITLPVHLKDKSNRFIKLELGLTKIIIREPLYVVGW